ncbi:hypothetical protein RO3G_06563 [Rhizopus delemar RA 99-880]|uniref:Multidrug resistance protein 1 n=1 Tax=Rhizopus delemar (strain RA 99-880 / ATCC MYA-4621 / FGSC 9543 / NRRL 43880) TaxID=246409 RepID=I1C078_RHIO9|nr:hypothetical protein RO3G_06563 [Rhizopus delemar RA 99-880]KAG1496208.1 hypothetical protein G6F54_006636 [Rhizopus delemar]|eukprot:EIE81858.1 hypothetical protein RO3G_06563 [Rhizopus delemar RA 99-880]
MIKKKNVPNGYEDQLKSTKKSKQHAISILQLFRFSTTSERMMILLATLCSIAAGSIQPCSILIYGRFISKLTATLSDVDQLLDVTAPVIHIMAYLGTAVLVSAYISNCLWIMTGEGQTRRIRSLYLHAVLRQDIGWFDKAADGSLNTRLATDTQLIQDGISEKFGLIVTLSAQFMAGVIVAFIEGWQLAILILAMLPVLTITVIAMSHFMRKYIKLSQDSYADAGSVAEQTFNAIRTIYSFSLQKRMSARYEVELDKARKMGIKRGITIGAGFAFFMFFLFCCYALILWYGTKLVTEGKLSGSTVLVVFLSMMMGCMAFIRLPTNLSAVSGACGAAYKIYEIIDRVPDIDPDSEQGVIPTSVQGALEFKNVMFKYPTRPDLTILEDLSLTIKPGMTVAFVGPSGSGKSTSVHLIQRFYDPLSGQITLDGHDLKTLNVKWLRQQIGIVSQEPVLFNMSIRQNLLMGTLKDVSDEKIIAACKEANCHLFISQLPHGYDTIVGDHGGMLSGGQKQRIAIARAILKNPKILLLDEATSALDTQSERLVQQALDKVAANRTTVIIAHRLSTVRNADLIVVMDHGNIVEQGTHAELVKMNGVYADLVQKQAIDTILTEEKEDETVGDGTDSLLEQEKELLQKTLTHESERNNALKMVSSRDEKYVFYESSDKDSLDAYDLKIKREKEEKEKMKKQRAPVWKVLFDMRQEWWLIFFGVIASIIAGCIFPVYALFFSKIIIIITVPGNSISSEPLKGTNLYAFLFVIIGIAAFIGYGGQNLLFEIAGENYTKRLRAKIFASYLRQEIGFFDEEDHNTGSLISTLAVDARNVNEMVTRVWGDVTAMFATIAFALITAMVYSWALTLIVFCFAPIITITTSYERMVQKGFEDTTKKANAHSGKVAGEAIREVRTVTSLNKQSHFEERYFHATERPHRLAMRKAYLSSIAYSLNKGINIYTSCVAFYAGVRLIMSGMIDFEKMFTSMTIIMTAAESAGRSSTFAATFAKAKYSAIASFEVIERQPKIDSDLEGIEPKVGSVKGDIGFENIKFRYPARPENPIFDGEFNLKCKANQTIALVGPSGCGKSTTIGMLQRWYDPSDGKVSLDDLDTKSYSLHNLRSHMALVSQEPSLFDMSVGENIRFGIIEGDHVSQDDIEEACKAANIHDFVVSLPDGYGTRVGDKGSQLSGGQKQRIAIARALIRKPKVLLLDEATSALDSDSEKAVQAAIDNILDQGGRTTITIAHRLSTIQNADLICVVKDGKVVEQGTHWELLSLDRVYAGLVKEQSLTVL